MWENTHNFAGLSSIYIERQKAGHLNRFYQSITIPPKEGGNGFAIPPKERGNVFAIPVDLFC